MKADSVQACWGLGGGKRGRCSRRCRRRWGGRLKGKGRGRDESGGGEGEVERKVKTPLRAICGNAEQINNCACFPFLKQRAFDIDGPNSPQQRRQTTAAASAIHLSRFFRSRTSTAVQSANSLNPAKHGPPRCLGVPWNEKSYGRPRSVFPGPLLAHVSSAGTGFATSRRLQRPVAGHRGSPRRTRWSSSDLNTV